MIKITLKDGSVKELAAPQSIADFTKDLSMGLYRNACCALVDGKVADLCDLLDHDCAVEILTFEDEQGQRAFNHTASHILAQAVQHLFPGAKLAIGPAIEDGFYSISMSLPPSPRRTWKSWRPKWPPSPSRICPLSASPCRWRRPKS